MNTQGFKISHSGTVVTISKTGVSPELFADEVYKTECLLDNFDRSQAGSQWGCDGIGFEIQRNLGHVEIKKSGVGPRKFKQGMTRLQAS